MRVLVPGSATTEAAVNVDFRITNCWVPDDQDLINHCSADASQYAVRCTRHMAGNRYTFHV